MEAIERNLNNFGFMGEVEWQLWNELKEFDLCTAKHSAITLSYFNGMIHDRLKVKGQEFTLATEMKVAHIDIQAIQRAAFLHDCGKLYLSKAGKDLIRSSKKLDSEEREITEEHEYLSEKALREKGFYLEALIAGQHHNYAGQQLQVKFQIRPLGIEVGVADLLHLTDVQEALRADRPYRKTLSPLQTLSLIVDEVKAGRVSFKTGLLWIFIQMEKLKNSYLLYNIASSAWGEIESLLRIKEFLSENKNQIAIGQMTVA